VIRLDRLYVDNFKALRQVGLRFPAQGSVLIEGLNESGKSTLFEAIYFALYGRPLVSEAGHESVIRYGAEAACVELALYVDATELVVRRRLRRGKPSLAHLLVRRADGTTEKIQGVVAVTQRLVAELGGLDGQTLLNSCFVEQKKLQRLEGLDAAARRHALLRLLNLDALAALETRFKPTAADDEAVRVAEARHALARLRDELPAREAAVRAVDARLHARQVRETLAQREAAKQALATCQAEADRLAATRAALAARLERCARLDRAIGQLDVLTQALERARRAGAAAATARQALEAAQRAATITLPALERQLDALRDLLAALDALAAGEAALVALEAAAQAEAACQQLAARVDALEAEAARLAARLAEADALRAARDGAARCRLGAEQLAEALAARGAAEATLTTARAEAETALPAARERAATLLGAADALATAQATARAADELLAQVDALAAAEARAAGAQAARQAAAQAVDESTRGLQALEAEREQAPAMDHAQRASLLLAWCDARAALDQGQHAAATRQARVAAWEATRAQAAAAHTAARSAGRRAAGCGAGAGAALLIAVGLAAVGLLAPAAVVLTASVVLAVGATRVWQQASAAQATARALDRRAAALEHELAALEATIAAHASARERLAAAEQGLRELGEPLPLSLEAARTRLAVLQQAAHGPAQPPPDRARVEDAIRRLRQRHTELAAALAREEAIARRAQDELETARAALNATWPPAERLGLDTLTLRERARARQRQAQAILAAAQQRAATLRLPASPEALRLAAAEVAAEVRQLERRAAALPVLEQQAREAAARATQLASQFAAELATLQAALTRVTLPSEVLGELAVAAPADHTAARLLAQQLAGLATRFDAQLAALEPHTLAAAQAAHREQLGHARAQLGEQRAARAAALDTARARFAIWAARAQTAPSELPAASAADAEAVPLDAQAQDPLEPAHREPLRRAVDAWRARCAAAGRRLGVAPTPLDVQAALARLAAEREQAAAEAQRVTECAAALAIAEGDAAAATAALATARTAAQDALAALAPDDAPPSAFAPMTPLAPDEAAQGRIRELAAALRDRLVALDAPAARRELDAVARAQGQVQAEIAHAEQALAAASTRLATRLAEVGLSVEASPAELRAALPALADPALPDVESLERERDTLLTELGALRAQVAALEQEFHLAGVALDLAACEAAYQEAVHQRDVKQYTSRIVALARSNLVGRVLPSTEHNLRLLLPQLTAQRYHDAQLAEDYQLTVWDAEAGRFVAKELFSGGTKDQFSLALRLAFALATLPQERGTVPGFLFLDEPLSAFDLPRTEALIALLTEGYIARSFAQIFLISHSRAFDPGRFTHYLRLHEGTIAETTLTRYTPDWAPQAKSGAHELDVRLPRVPTPVAGGDPR